MILGTLTSVTLLLICYINLAAEQYTWASEFAIDAKKEAPNFENVVCSEFGNYSRLP